MDILRRVQTKLPKQLCKLILHVVVKSSLEHNVRLILFWCVRFLGYHEEREIPSLCKSVFDATCYLMEEKLAYSGNEQVVSH